MILRRSRFVHQLPVGKDRTLIVHAISHMRLPADADVSTLIDHFAQPRRIPEDCEAMAALIAKPDEKLAELRDVVERTVMEVANAPDQIHPAELRELQRRMDSESLLFKVRIIESNLRTPGQKL